MKALCFTRTKRALALFMQLDSTTLLLCYWGTLSLALAKSCTQFARTVEKACDSLMQKRSTFTICYAQIIQQRHFAAHLYMALELFTFVNPSRQGSLHSLRSFIRRTSRRSCQRRDTRIDRDKEKLLRNKLIALKESALPSHQSWDQFCILIMVNKLENNCIDLYQLI